MSRLRALQQDFQHYVLLPDGRMDHQVGASTQAGAQERLGIYANAYRLRLLEALDTDFPGLHSLVGDEEFDRLGRAYIDAYPSQHYSLRWYGHQVAAFLRATPPYADHPVLTEMAQFEWAMSLAFDADNSTVVSVEDMLALPPGAWTGLGLQAHASVQRLNLQWNVPVFWKAVQAEQEPQAPQQAESPLGWVLWRQELNTYFRSLSVDEAWGLDALLSGVNFPDLCQGLCEWVDEEHAPAHAAGMLKRWVQDGMVRGIILPQS